VKDQSTGLQSLKGGKFLDIGSGIDFLDLATKEWVIKLKIDKGKYISLKKVLLCKRNSNMQKQFIEYEKIFSTTYISFISLTK
jgi:hypothetical protein